MHPNGPKPDWSPLQYLRFAQERTQPSIDLVSRIKLENPQRIIDIGCGPGNSTQVLAQRWPESRIVGLDSSAQMIEKARQDYPEQEWLLADAADLQLSTTFDLLFSNATIQWILHHERLLTNFMELVNSGGALAIQLPKFMEMPLGRSIGEVAGRAHWKRLAEGFGQLFTQHDFPFYYQVLRRHATSLEMWETSYVHVLENQPAIVEWIRSTGLKPYLDRLESAEQKERFEAEVFVEIKKNYPALPDGKVLFPFPRMFFIAYKK